MTKEGGQHWTRADNDKPIKVAALIFDGLPMFEFGIVAEIFGLPRPELGVPLYDFRTVSLEPGPLRASGGLRVEPTDEVSVLKTADTLVLPGWRGKDAVVPDAYIEALRAADKRGARIVSICSGVYVLAASGLLAGKSATTHWRYVQDFSQKFPNVSLKPNALYVESGNIISSAGSSAGIDACLHIVRRDYGAAIANSVARRLVMHSHRQGDQAQYIEQPIPTSGSDHRISALLNQLRSNLSAQHTIGSMASSTGMTARTFQRRFTALTGLPPMKWIMRERVSQARELLETTHLSVDEISAQLGFGDTGVLRYHFRRALDISPGHYRKRFKAQPPNKHSRATIS